MNTFDIIFIVLFYIFAICGVLYFIYLTFNIVSAIVESRHFIKTSNSIFKSIKDKLILNRNDLYKIYYDEFSSCFNSFNSFLEALIKKLMLGTSDDKIDKTFNKDDLLEIKQFVEKIIEEENYNMPFDGVPDNEKSSLLAIVQMTEQNNNSIGIKLELDKIAISLRNNLKRIKKEAIMNKLALSVSVLGIVITVFFQLWGKTSLKNEDIERINENTNKTIIVTIDSIKTMQNELREHTTDSIQ